MWNELAKLHYKLLQMLQDTMQWSRWTKQGDVSNPSYNVDNVFLVSKLKH